MNNKTIAAMIGAIALLCSSNAHAQIANISTRGYIGDGDQIMIAGFILNAPATVVVRGIGPTLAQYGVSNFLGDPTLGLYWHDDTDGGRPYLIGTNDDWDWPDPSIAQRLAGLAPTNELESVILISLPAGRYTCIMAGLSGGTGIGLLEVYLMP
jgi:hypothetical protein